MKIAVVGSRTFDDYELLRGVMRSERVSCIVSGGARGADALAERYASDRKLDIQIMGAEWAKLGRCAGPLRNKKIVGVIDRMVAFWDGKSRGTLNAIKECRKVGKPVRVIYYSAKPIVDVVFTPDGLAVASR